MCDSFGDSVEVLGIKLHFKKHGSEGGGSRHAYFLTRSKAQGLHLGEKHVIDTLEGVTPTNGHMYPAPAQRTG